MSLLPCSSCGRHVRITDAACPFCAAVLPEGRTAVDAILPRAKRAITFVAASVAVAACSNTPDSQVTPDNTATATATATSAGGDTQPTATATATQTATATASAASTPSATPSAKPSATPSASAVASASSKPPVAPPTFTSPPTKPTGPQTRYGLPPYLAEDEIV